MARIDRFQVTDEEHEAHVDQMEERQLQTGEYIDPFTGIKLPKGQLLLREPNRLARRRLARWRSKVSK